MAEKEQARPLAPASHILRSDAPALYIRRSDDAPASVRSASYVVRSDEDEALSAHFRLRQPSCLKCCGITGALFLILAVVALALVFTVFHVKDPIISMKRVQIPHLAQLVSSANITGANITAVVDVSVKNPNAASFRYGNSTTELYYGGEFVGEGRIPAGKAAARRTQRVNVTVEVAPARIAKAARLSSDLAAGNLTMESSARIDGRVKILKIIRKHVVVRLNCTITYVIASQEMKEKCHQRVSF